MTNSGFNKATQYDLNSQEDLRVNIDIIKKQLKDNFKKIVLEFELSFKFFAFYNIAVESLGKENIELISNQAYLNKFKEDIEIFEKNYQTVICSDKIPNCFYYTKNDIIFKNKEKNSFFSNLYDSEVYLMSNPKNAIIFSANVNEFITEKTRLYDILLKNLDFNKKSFFDIDARKILKDKFVDPPNSLLKESELDEFFKYYKK